MLNSNLSHYIMKFQQQQECLSIHLQATAHFLNILNLQKLQSSLSHSLMEFKFIETKEVLRVMWLSQAMYNVTGKKRTSGLSDCTTN